MQGHVNKPGTYVPDSSLVWPAKPDEPLLKPKHLRQVVVDENYPFIDRSFKFFLWRNFIFFCVWTLVFFLQHVRYGIKFKGLKNLRKNKALFKNGAVTVSNHVYRWDYLAVVQATKKRLWFPARAENLMGKDAGLIRAVGGIPVAKNFSGMKKFYEAFDEMFLAVFPDFVSRVNAYMKEGCEYQDSYKGMISTELRVLAILRLGMTGSADIAHFLNCSLSTVYTYRSRAAEKSRLDREAFEKAIKSIPLL